MSSTKRGTASTRLSITLTQDQYRELERVATRKRVSLAWVVRYAVDLYLEAQSPLFAGRINSSSLDNVE